MGKMTRVKASTVAAACIALCVVLPMAFHAIPNAGSIFLPMHIPVLLCGLMCGWPFGLVCGLLGSLLSTLLTGMPPIAMLPSMMVELAVYGAAAGLMMQFVHTKKLYADLYISLITALIAGRVIGGVAKALIFFAGAYSMQAWIAASVVTCWPGLVIQLLFIPAIVTALQKAQLVPQYSHRKTNGKEPTETDG